MNKRNWYQFTIFKMRIHHTSHAFHLSFVMEGNVLLAQVYFCLQNQFAICANVCTFLPFSKSLSFVKCAHSTTMASSRRTHKPPTAFDLWLPFFWKSLPEKEKSVYKYFLYSLLYHLWQIHIHLQMRICLLLRWSKYLQAHAVGVCVEWVGLPLLFVVWFCGIGTNE